MEPDPPYWDDDDFGPEGREEECPEGFRWNCCNKLGTDEGCKYGMHLTEFIEVERNLRRMRE